MSDGTDRDRLRALLDGQAPRPSRRARIVDWCWRVVWAYGRLALLPLGLWRCDECGQPLPDRLIDHDCPTDDEAWSTGWTLENL